MTVCVKLETIVKMGEMISNLEQQNEQLQKKLDIAVKALNRIREVSAYNPGQLSYVGQFATRKTKTALKEIDLVETSMSLAKEEQ